MKTPRISGVAIAAGTLLMAAGGTTLVSPTEAAGSAQTAYVTGAPMPAWLGLATSDGRDAIQLADGCDAVLPGLNVVQLRLENSHLALQVVDPILGVQADVCEVAVRRHMSDVPCARNHDGVCDVSFS